MASLVPGSNTSKPHDETEAAVSRRRSPSAIVDLHGYLAAVVAGVAIGAIAGILLAAILFYKEVGTTAPLAVASVATVAGGAIGVIATVSRRQRD